MPILFNPYKKKGVFMMPAGGLGPSVSAAFDYSKSSYHQDETDPTPTIKGTTGGTFSATSGLVFVDSGSNTGSSTGQIDLTASTIQANTVTYTIDGVSENRSLSVTASPYLDNTHSMEFDSASSNYIDLGTGLNIFRYNINESYTVSLWYKATVAGGFNTIINLGANSYRFCLLSATLGRITFGAGNSSTITVTYNWMPTAGAINDGNWHHICIVQDSSGGSVNLTPYVDGSPSGSAAGTTAAITENNNRIGDGYYGGIDGNIDEVAIWNTALSSDAVQEIYNATNNNSGKALDLTTSSGNYSSADASALQYFNRMGD